MQVNLYSAFKDAAGIKTFPLDLPAGSTVDDAIQAIVIKFPAIKNVWFKNENELYAHVQISINQLDILSLPEGYQTLLKKEDVLDFFPPIVGG